MDSANINKQSHLEDIFSSSDCLSWEILTSYYNKSLPKDKQYIVEKHLLECELCSDALEGMNEMNDLTVHKSIIDKINRNIQTQSGLEKSNHFKLEINYQTIAIAASLLLIIGVSTVYFSMFYSPETNNISDASLTKEAPKTSTTTNKEHYRKAGRAPLEADTDKKVLADLDTKETSTPIPPASIKTPIEYGGTTAVQSMEEEPAETSEPLESDNISMADETAPQVESAQEDIETFADKAAEQQIARAVSSTSEQEDEKDKNYAASKSAKAPASSPELKKQKAVNSIYKDASFPGGTNELHKYIRSNIIIPESDKPQNESDKVIVKFTIKKNGKISNIRIEQGATDSYNKEAIRLVNNMPKWEAATQEGEPIESEYVLPIEFKD